MIPRNFLLEWAEKTPWPGQDQVEQDLILSRAIADIFADDFLAERVAFRGGTALNKLIFPSPYRYSEDIDLVQVGPEPIGPVLDRVRDVLGSWLGKANSEVKENAAKLRYRFTSETGQSGKIKIEINTREHGAFLGYSSRSFQIDSRWHQGQATVRTFALEEVLATKLRALLQRDKGRDLFDLKQAFDHFPDLDHAAVVDLFQRYLNRSGTVISRAMAEQRVLNKLEGGAALADVRALVPFAMSESVTNEAGLSAAAYVLTCLVEKLPGSAWETTADTVERLGLRTYLDDAAAACSSRPGPK